MGLDETFADRAVDGPEVEFACLTNVPFGPFCRGDDLGVSFDYLKFSGDPLAFVGYALAHVHSEYRYSFPIYPVYFVEDDHRRFVPLELYRVFEIQMPKSISSLYRVE